jgi:hypothetical protein
MNLVKLYTHNGAIMIDTAQLASGRRLLTIYNLRGRKLSDSAKTEKERIQAGYGVHRENLFASAKLAAAHRDAIYADMRARAVIANAVQ